MNGYNELLSVIEKFSRKLMKQATVSRNFDDERGIIKKFSLKYKTRRLAVNQKGLSNNNLLNGAWQDDDNY